MKKSALSFIVLGVTVLFSGCATKTASKTAAAKTVTAPATSTSAASSTTTTNAASVLTTDKDRNSYALGMSVAQTVKHAGLDIDPDLVARGLKDSLSASGTTLLTPEQMMAAVNNLRQQAMANRQKMQMQQGQSNELEGAKFLAENKTKPGVVTLPDGLQYQIIKEGSGEMPGPNDVVTVNYRGTFVNGTEFDSSAKNGHPAQFPVGRVIHGWTEALQKMTVGSKWRVFVPGSLAYGAMGHPPTIEPNKTLIFDVELLSVQHQAAAAPRQPLTSDIIKVPSAEEMKNGAKIETIKASDVQKMQQEQNATNNSTN